MAFYGTLVFSNVMSRHDLSRRTFIKTTTAGAAVSLMMEYPRQKAVPASKSTRRALAISRH